MKKQETNSKEVVLVELAKEDQLMTVYGEYIASDNNKKYTKCRDWITDDA